MEHWYTLFTKPRMERVFGRNLAARGVEVYVPLIEYHGKRGNLLDKPFFPRYAFARFDWHDEGISRLQWTPGLKHVVTFSGKPAIMRDSTIVAMREQLEQLDGDEFLSLKPGERVIVKDGPFKDLVGVFERRMNGQQRVAVLMEMLGHEARIIFNERDIERLA